MLTEDPSHNTRWSAQVSRRGFLISSRPLNAAAAAATTAAVAAAVAPAATSFVFISIDVFNNEKSSENEREKRRETPLIDALHNINLRRVFPF
jgi:hypothetical protein